jgi:hypothetical protein
MGTQPLIVLLEECVIHGRAGKDQLYEWFVGQQRHIEQAIRNANENQSIRAQWVKADCVLPQDTSDLVEWVHESPLFFVLVDSLDEPRKARYWRGRWIIDGCLGDYIVTHWMYGPKY